MLTCILDLHTGKYKVTEKGDEENDEDGDNFDGLPEEEVHNIFQDISYLCYIILKISNFRITNIVQEEFDDDDDDDEGDEDGDGKHLSILVFHVMLLDLFRISFPT